MANSFIGDSSLPLGLRNNNPGNIRPVGTGIWEGQIDTNKGFVVFQDISWGIRAFAMNLYSSVTKHGTDTLTKYITRYAPPSDHNDTAGYIAYVSDSTGINPDDTMPTDISSVKAILRAQMEKEIGAKYADMITDEDIDEGFALLDSPIASFFSATSIFAQNSVSLAKSNPKSTVLIIVGIVFVVYGAFMLHRKFSKK